MTNFNFSLLVWMHHGQTKTIGVHRVHERALPILLNDFNIFFQVLLERTSFAVVQIADFVCSMNNVLHKL